MNIIRTAEIGRFRVTNLTTPKSLAAQRTQKSPLGHTGATGRITLGNAPVFVDLKFSGWRLFWLRAIICYVRVESRERQINRQIDKDQGWEEEVVERERERAWDRVDALRVLPFGMGGTLNRITIRHGDVIHLHYYFSRERP